MKMDSSMNIKTKPKNHHMETLLATCYIHCGAHNSMLQRAACDQPGYMPTYLVAMKKIIKNKNKNLDNRRVFDVSQLIATHNSQLTTQHWRLHSWTLVHKPWFTGCNALHKSVGGFFWHQWQNPMQTHSSQLIHSSQGYFPNTICLGERNTFPKITLQKYVMFSTSFTSRVTWTAFALWWIVSK